MFFPYRHAIDLTIGLTHGIPLSTDSHEKTHSCTAVLLLKIEQALLALSHSPRGCRETRMLFVKGIPRRSISELNFLMVYSNKKE